MRRLPTRQIEVRGSAYRVDGGPAIVDFQSFLADLDRAVGDVLAREVEFDDFAASVLGPSPAPDSKTSLRHAVSAWYERYHTLMDRALPTTSWGPSRLDAVAMIFNRVTGLDLGPEPSRLIRKTFIAPRRPLDTPSCGTRRDRTRRNGRDLPITEMSFWLCPATWVRSTGCSPSWNRDAPEARWRSTT